MKSEIIHLRISPELKRKLLEKSKEQNRNLSDIIRLELENNIPNDENIVLRDEIHIFQSYYFINLYSWLFAVKINPELSLNLYTLNDIKKCIQIIIVFEKLPDDVRLAMVAIYHQILYSINKKSKFEYHKNFEYNNHVITIINYCLNISSNKI
ncbi:MAG: hypothetical protein L6Q46_01055 [Flavobacterium sp.]|uniref:hypothetical protein n=1 Tax=Flavobacterium sp. TaxID=239 RepID=UPI0025BA5EB5|nr:hypothetical protein [Flavobacterium sp.]MCK6606872.1 hypothetical protein [Flavobacterium sp.]